jgi:hypothetical protein
VINPQGSGSVVAVVVAAWEAVEGALFIGLHAVREKEMATNKIAENRGKVSIWSLLTVQVVAVN